MTPIPSDAHIPGKTRIIDLSASSPASKMTSAAGRALSRAFDVSAEALHPVSLEDILPSFKTAIEVLNSYSSELAEALKESTSRPLLGHGRFGSIVLDPLQKMGELQPEVRARKLQELAEQISKYSPTGKDRVAIARKSFLEKILKDSGQVAFAFDQFLQTLREAVREPATPEKLGRLARICDDDDIPATYRKYAFNGLQSHLVRAGTTVLAQIQAHPLTNTDLKLLLAWPRIAPSFPAARLLLLSAVTIPAMQHAIDLVQALPDAAPGTIAKASDNPLHNTDHNIGLSQAVLMMEADDPVAVLDLPNTINGLRTFFSTALAGAIPHSTLIELCQTEATEHPIDPSLLRSKIATLAPEVRAQLAILAHYLGAIGTLAPQKFGAIGAIGSTGDNAHRWIKSIALAAPAYFGQDAAVLHKTGIMDRTCELLETLITHRETFF